MRRGTLGVLGGMGPMAGADFVAKVVAATPARGDQEHIPLVLFSNPIIPDRSAAILRKGPSPFPLLRKGLWFLEQAGATVIAMPCNTAHFWYDELQAETSVPIVHIVDAVIARLKAEKKRVGMVGLLATDGTVRSGIYKTRLKDEGIACVVPSARQQALLMADIRAIKAGRRLGGATLRVAESLRTRGAQRIILACTELPLLFESGAAGDIVDATHALADACIKYIRGGSRAPSRRLPS